jgi:hypothetical protein
MGTILGRSKSQPLFITLDTSCLTEASFQFRAVGAAMVALLPTTPRWRSLNLVVGIDTMSFVPLDTARFLTLQYLNVQSAAVPTLGLTDMTFVGIFRLLSHLPSLEYLEFGVQSHPEEEPVIPDELRYPLTANIRGLALSVSGRSFLETPSILALASNLASLVLSGDVTIHVSVALPSLKHLDISKINENSIQDLSNLKLESLDSLAVSGATGRLSKLLKIIPNLQSQPGPRHLILDFSDQELVEVEESYVLHLFDLLSSLHDIVVLLGNRLSYEPRDLSREKSEHASLKYRWETTLFNIFTLLNYDQHSKLPCLRRLVCNSCFSFKEGVQSRPEVSAVPHTFFAMLKSRGYSNGDLDADASPDTGMVSAPAGGQRYPVSSSQSFDSTSHSPAILESFVWQSNLALTFSQNTASEQQLGQLKTRGFKIEYYYEARAAGARTIYRG